MALDDLSSKANYDPKNLAPLLESFASFFGLPRTGIGFTYPTSKETEITHPNDRDRLNEHRAKTTAPSGAMSRYEEAAKRSERLKRYQEENNVTFFLPFN